MFIEDEVGWFFTPERPSPDTFRLPWGAMEREEIIRWQTEIGGLGDNSTVVVTQNLAVEPNRFGPHGLVTLHYKLQYQAKPMGRLYRMLETFITNDDLLSHPFYILPPERPVFWVLGMHLPNFLATQLNFDHDNTGPFSHEGVAASICAVVSAQIAAYFGSKQVWVDYRDPRLLRLTVWSGGTDPAHDYRLEYHIWLPKDFTVADVRLPW